jgi:hypothetical protein
MMCAVRRALPPGIALILAVAALPLRAQAPEPIADLRETLERAGQHVAQFYERAPRIVCLETVVLQSLSPTFSLEGTGRELTYEVRISWTHGAPPHEANVVRKLLTVDGRPAQPSAEPTCLDPKTVATDALSFLLPQSSGRERGRVWLDAETGEAVRLDTQLMGMMEIPVPLDRQRSGRPSSIIFERLDESTHFRAVRFSEPDETLTLPESIESMTVARRSAAPRLRTTITFSQYRRDTGGGGGR